MYFSFDQKNLCVSYCYISIKNYACNIHMFVYNMYIYIYRHLNHTRNGPHRNSTTKAASRHRLEVVQSFINPLARVLNGLSSGILHRATAWKHRGCLGLIGICVPSLKALQFSFLWSFCHIPLTFFWVRLEGSRGKTPDGEVNHGLVVL